MTNFDAYAASYDEVFTNTKIGKLQRGRVWKYLNALPIEKMSVLELNGGTGHDAEYFLSQGHQVLFSDQSEKMIELAKNRLSRSENIDFEVIDLHQLLSYDLGQKFDLIFSNFGGVNAIPLSKLSEVKEFAEKHLKEGGRLSMVIMPRNTILDRWYRALKKLPPIKREASQPTEVNIGSQSFPTFYFNVEDLQNSFTGFKLTDKRIIGYLPSYFNQGFLTNGMFWPIIQVIESIFCRFRFWVNQADHFLVEFKKDNT